MTESKRTKWSLDEAITAGEKACNLGITYIDQMGGRLTPEKLNEMKANVGLLKEFKEKKVENLVGQKSKTAAKDNYMELLKTKMKNLRNIVRGANTSTPGLQKAFGIGEHLTGNESSIIAASHLIVSAYNNNKEWCNQTGIIDADISDLKALAKKFEEKDKEQDDAIKTKTTGTFDKNVLQRTVEDDATLVSNLGVNVFELKDSSVARLFAAIIPSSDNGSNNNDDEEGNNTSSETTDEKED